MRYRGLKFTLCVLCIVIRTNAQTLNVATYNIRLAIGSDSIAGNGWHQRNPIVTQLIKFHDFDVFGSQEVLQRQLDDMLRGLPEYAYVGVGRNDGKRDGEYSPIFYKKDKFSLIQSGHFWLSQTDDKPSVGWDAALPRICAWAKLKMKDSGKVFWFFNLHMDHIGVTARFESSKLVLQKIKTLCGNEPVILVGDFNSDQNSDGYKVLTESTWLKDTYNLAQTRYAPNGTFNAFNINAKTDGRIDHIFIGNGVLAKRYGMLTDVYWSPTHKAEGEQYTVRLPSDHYPVMAVVSFGR